MLIDFCKKTVGTSGGDGYSETVLYQNEDGSCEVHFYSRYEGDVEETHSVYTVDKAVIDDAYEIIDRNNIASWNETRYGPGMDGAVYVLKFRNEDGVYVRVSSENMPEDGLDIMCSVNNCLNRYVKEELALKVTTDNQSIQVGDILDLTDWIGKTAEELDLVDHVENGICNISGSFLGMPAKGMVSFISRKGDDSSTADNIRITVENSSVFDLYEQLKGLYGGCTGQGTEPYVASNGGAVKWYTFTTGPALLMIQQGNNNSFSSVSIVQNPEPDSMEELALRRMPEQDLSKLHGRMTMRVSGYDKGILTISVTNDLGTDSSFSGTIEIAKSEDNGNTYGFLVPVDTVLLPKTDTETCAIADKETKELTFDMKEYGKVRTGKYMVRLGEMKAYFDLIPADEVESTPPEVRWFCPNCGRQNIDTDSCVYCGIAKDQA